ncbi:hypothetical protein J1605_018661 [Eschrichtius robustus]|uniref:Uncharacterized protein n=1 Tax=Eschrichtius robustus TaxID=9764 RepID=A0AB34HUK4_ESCRO|nr:hypothetical protein J1605_018661 [Eschrichtius robustus]
MRGEPAASEAGVTLQQPEARCVFSRAVFTPPTSVLSLRSDQSPSLSSQPHPVRPGGLADKPLGLLSAARRRASVRESLRFALRTPVAALSSMAPKLPPSATRSLRPQRGFLEQFHV